MHRRLPRGRLLGSTEREAQRTTEKKGREERQKEGERGERVWTKGK